MLVVRFGGHLGEALGACWRLEGYFGRSVGALGLLGETFGAPLGALGDSSEASGVLGETLDGPWASFRAPQWGLRKLLTSFMLAFGCLGLSGGGHCGEQVSIVVRIVVSTVVSIVISNLVSIVLSIVMSKVVSIVISTVVGVVVSIVTWYAGMKRGGRGWDHGMV